MEKADPAQKLYTRMRLWEFPDQYVIEPTDGVSGSCLSVSRVDGSLNLIDEIPHCTSLRVPKIRTIFGVVGMLKLLAGSYLLVITERECVGSYLGHPIFKISSMKILPCDHSLKNTPVEQKKMETEFSELLNVAERTPGLYFSYDVNITLSAQRLHDLGDESKLLPLWRQAFRTFKQPLQKILLTLLSLHEGVLVELALGCGEEGLILMDMLQILWKIRGSIPLLWDQIVDLTYKPKFEIVRPEEAARVVERHFLDIRKKYGNVLAADLVNKHGGEGRLSEKFANAMQHIVSDDVRYLHFDFHRICGHIHFERLSILYDQIEDFLVKNRYLLINEKCEKVEGQTGVVRTNCIDCLDRTNVTQSMIGRKMLEFQLRRLGVFDAEETISTHPNFDESFKILWANHGDEISIQYSGTPALKGDFVRCGQRTMQGILNDGWNSLMRYYLNNFCDGTKQDAIDLLQGHYIVSVARDMTPPSQKGGIEAIASFPLALLLIVTGFFFAMMSLRRVRYNIWNLLISIIWASMSLAIAAVVKANGRIFCNRPRLHKPPR
ncbi:hypothetical protein RJ639_017792 [Escallonia herrerae]|uniref:SAC domain-containing protein n=1 Tax=Escallonia herrerae TaxID=1293975 RepID=A0AA88VET5_9ASTE|nr:hypothetical protein RJ639_017792 [Escallonia herrerae]